MRFLCLFFILSGCAKKDSLQHQLQTPHAVSQQQLDALDDDDYAQLFVIARDVNAPLYERVRALSFVGHRPGKEAELLWQEARSWPESQLRVQAAYSQAASLQKDPVAFNALILSLLADNDFEIRQVGIQAMFALNHPEAKTLAREQLKIEREPVLIQLLERRLK